MINKLLPAMLILCISFMAHSAFFYVSKNGDNTDGASWNTAWNELDQIDWDAIGPGDYVFLDGGSSTMQYEKALIVPIGKSGKSGNPITIRLSPEPGRNGKVVIFGGLSEPLPWCGQKDFANVEGQLGGAIGILGSWIVLDGTKWGGITIHGSRAGMGVGGRDADVSNVLVRNIEIYECGYGRQLRDGTWRPDGFGAWIYGKDITLERMLFRDIGQDGLNGGPLENFTLRQSWIYNTRKQPSSDQWWNYCQANHADGIQFYAGGPDQGPMLIEDCVIGPGFMQGLLLGQYANHYTTLNYVTIRHTLLYGNSQNVLGYELTEPQGWILENVTSYAEFSGEPRNLLIDGRGHTIRNSILCKGSVWFRLERPSCLGNIVCWPVPTWMGTSADPQFTNPAAGDFSLQPGSPAAGKGSRVTSGEKLFELFPDEDIPVDGKNIANLNRGMHRMTNPKTHDAGLKNNGENYLANGKKARMDAGNGTFRGPGLLIQVKGNFIKKVLYYR